MTQRDAGLSIIEVLISIAIIAALSASVLTFLPSLLQINVNTNNAQRLEAAAKGYFENVKSEWSETDRFDDRILETPDPVGEGFTCTRGAIVDPDDTVAPNVARRLQVTIRCVTTGKTTGPVFSLEIARP